MSGKFPVMGEGRPCYVIAEAGVNHNGDVDRALALIDAAYDAGADAVKFQTFRSELLVTESADGAEYQKRNLGKETTQFEMLRQLELAPADFKRLAEHARLRGITFLSTPFDVESADFLESLDLPLYKIGSGELTHHALLRHVAQKGCPVILSTGMASLDEVREAVEVIRAEGAPLILLHCVSNYPAAPHDLNLRAIRTLAESFGVPVGFSDHTQGISMASLAVAAGACVVEKHFTLSRELPGPDHRASLEPDELREMVAAIRETEMILGNGEKVPAASERSVAEAARRSWVAAGALEKGHVLQACDLILRRPGTGLAEKELPKLLNRRLSCSLSAGAVLSLNDLEAES